MQVNIIIRILFIIFIHVLPVSTSAQAPMTIEEFEARVTGKTLDFSIDNAPAYGREEYLPNRRVRWSYLDGTCQEGYYYQFGAQICFDYRNGNAHQCWVYFETDGQLSARYMNEISERIFYSFPSTEPLICQGPDIGV